MPSYAEDLVKEVKEAVERSTLDQPGTKPFHMKATISPSFERDRESGRTGEVEIWWASPTRWKRELRSPQFHQIEIVDATNHWEQDEGDFFPQWLQQTAVELTKPVPPLDYVLGQVSTAEVRRLMGQTNIGWTNASGTLDAPNILRSSVALQNSSGLLLYADGLGWGGEFKDYKDFHGRTTARTVSLGTPEVTAKVTTLEDLESVSAVFFDTTAAGGNQQPWRTDLIDEPSLRKNLLPMEPLSWPPLQDGPLEGNVTTEIVVDREGKVRDTGTIVSENPGVNEAGRDAVEKLRFKPFVADGMPVQVMSQLTIPFKTVRPPGAETFESARTYFEHGRQVSFPAFGNNNSYILRAEFEAKGRDGKIEKGTYEDIWISASQWRREANFGKSRYARSRNGEQTYELAEGPDVQMLRFVLKALEPIPAIDTFVESDWRMRRDTVDGTRTVRVLTGYESPDGKLDPEQARGFWFDDTGLLVKAYFGGIETKRQEFEDFSTVKVARRIDALRNGGLAMRIDITQVGPAGAVPTKAFEMKGHEWTRTFTAESR
jgi:hypothetical protein